MKDDTKRVIAVAAVGGVALYVLTRPTGEDAGLGGGGGMPLLPILPEETAESVGNIIYNIPGIPAMADFAGFEDPDVMPTKKEGRELLTKEALERGQTIEWDVAMPGTGAELTKKAKAVVETPLPEKTIINDFLEWVKSTPSEKGISARESLVGAATRYVEHRTERAAGTIDVLGGLVAGRDVGATKLYGQAQHALMSKKAAQVKITKETIERQQKIRWDAPAKGYTRSGKKMTVAQRDLTRESAAKGQTTVWD